MSSPRLEALLQISDTIVGTLQPLPEVILMCRSFPVLEDSEREHILKILRETKGLLGGPKGAAARLGLKRTTLQGKMKKLGIDRSSITY